MICNTCDNESFYVGGTVTISFEILDRFSGVAPTLTGVAMTITLPDGTEEPYTEASPEWEVVGGGVYRFNYIPQQAGEYSWELVVSGSYAGVAKGKFLVE